MAECSDRCRVGRHGVIGEVASDNLSLMALTISVGFVVDDAIVVVENIHRHIEEGETPYQAALNGSREIGFTVLSISFSLIAVFIPLLLMGGIIGRLFREFALTVTASIAVSALVSLTLAPMLCARFMRPESHDHGRVYRAIESVFDALLTFYRRTLDIVLRHQAMTLLVFFATMALTGVMLVYTPKGFFPIQDIGLINGISEGAQDISPDEMKRLQIEIDAVLLKDPAVEGVISLIGSSFGRRLRTSGVSTSSSSRAISAISTPRRSLIDCARSSPRSPASRRISSPRRTSRSAAASRAPRFSTRSRTPTSASSPNGRTSCSPK